MDLHYSQTPPPVEILAVGFTTLWIYTILKQRRERSAGISGFTTLWIYTILKLVQNKQTIDFCFTTLWIYTILKPYQGFSKQQFRFTTLWIYTILKRQLQVRLRPIVLLPYGFTLFSNWT